METKIKYCLQHLEIKVGNDIVSSEIWQNESNAWILKIKYPKVGESHYYEMVNMIDELFAEQYPFFANKLHKQSMGI